VIEAPALLDTDTLSLLSRGHVAVIGKARAYLEHHGRLTISAVTVFERLRGYRAAIREAKPFEEQLAQFELFVRTCIVLPVDAAAADVAATIWSGLSAKRRRALGDILIAGTASARGLSLVTRNRKDFEPMTDLVDLRLTSWG